MSIRYISIRTFAALVIILLLTGAAVAQNAVQFNGSSQYGTFGRAPSLGLKTFTLECWFQRTGTGVGTGTGSGGVTSAVPLITKGRAQADIPAVMNCNYFFGINTATNTLAADFEDTVTGGNHPLIAPTVLSNGTWYHAALTYDGSALRIYLNGRLDTSVVIGVNPEYRSYQYAGIASAFDTSGVAAGYLQGILDEVRIWNYARSLGEIQAAADSEITGPRTGLVGRWGLNEGSGTSIANSVPGGVNGTLANSPAWVTGAPFNLAFTPPSAPTGLTATAASPYRIDLAWTDNSNNEDGFEVWRSTDGLNFTLRTTTAAGAQSFGDSAVNSQSQYYYRVRARNGVGYSDYTNDANATTTTEGGYSLALGGSNAYVSFGSATALNTPVFTIETWFRRDGTGSSWTTGTGGITAAIPLVTKGTAETEDTTKDINYFLGIDAGTGVLVADFEKGAGTSSSQNYPIRGTTPILNGVWYHAAVTYDGTTWNLYLNGVLDSTKTIGPGVYPTSHSISPAAIGTSIRSDGTTKQGYFNGALDEVRIWNYARTVQQIDSTVNTQIITSQTGLIARWGMNEGSGSVVHANAGTSTSAAVSGSGWSWDAPAPFSLFSPPAAPSGLNAAGTAANLVTLTWTDNADSELGFQIERSTTGSGGPFSLLATVTANTETYGDTAVTPSTSYCYRVRAYNGAGSSAYTDVACATSGAEPSNALRLGSSGAYVTFGTGTGLNAASFTLETWFRRDGNGTTTTTGSGGIPDAIPLITKGAAEAENSSVDINYILGIRSSDSVLCADFEEGAGGSNPSLNHPLAGTTHITRNTWYHAAVTYDGTTMKLYLNGVLDGQLTIGQPAASATNSPAALGTSIQSNGTTVQGAFNGTLDEARIWNVARTAGEIQSTIDSQITVGQTGLMARWSLNEMSGSIVHGSAGTSFNGTVTGSGYSWVSGAPFSLDVNSAPGQPVLVSPANGATDVALSPTLSVTVSDPDADSMNVSFYGRTGGTAPDFTVVMLPDAQNYTAQMNGGTNAMFRAQTQWVVDNRVARNIVYVNQVGDITNDGDSYIIEWQRADTVMSTLEGPGIPFGISPGNHDKLVGTTYYNQFFGESRFAGRSYYGGHYGSNNLDNFQFFGAGGLEFIVINLEHSPSAGTLHWADSLLKAYSGKRALVFCHELVGTSGGWSGIGQTVYDSLKDNPNLFMMNSGHVPGEGRRQDIYAGDTVYSMLADYQSLTNGGSGWMRIYEFSPTNNVVHVKTYSPWLNQWNTGSSSQFDLPYNMSGTSWQLLATNAHVPSGSTTSTSWPGLANSTTYEWRADASDSLATTTGTTWNFTTAASGPVTHTITASAGLNGSISPSGSVTISDGRDTTFSISPATGYHIDSVLVDGVKVDSTTSYTFHNVVADHEIRAVFAVNQYTITPTAGANGSITPSVPTNVNYGGSQRFTFTPSTGYHVDSVLVDGSKVDSVVGYTFNNVTAIHTIRVAFAIDQFTITPTAGANGSITPSVPTSVNYGGSQRFTFTPSSGYHVDSVMVDGSKVDSVVGYTFNNVTAIHTIRVAFAIDQFTITPTAGANGSISPSVPTGVNYGGSQRFTFTPSTGYHVDSVLVDGSKVDSVAGYTFNNVTAIHTIRVTFAIDQFTITPTAGANGSISPSVPTGVNYGGSQRFTFTPSTGYHVDSVLVNGSKVDSVAGYTFNNVTANATIRVTFAIDQFTITPTAGANGSISPSVPKGVNYGGSQRFIFTPSTGYHVDSVMVDGSKVDSLAGYTFTDVTGSHTIRVTFAIDQFTITPTAGANGSISPSVPTSVSYGGSQRFTFTPSTGYHVDSVLVDGSKVDSVVGYTFNNVTAIHTIRVTFAIDQFTITPTAGANGSISPSVPTSVNYGGSQRFTFTPSTGYHVDSVLVDGSKVDSVAGYTFTGVTGSHTIRVTFAITQYTITATAGPNGSISPSGTVYLSHGASQRFTFLALAGHHVDSVIVDGARVDSVEGYTFTDVQVNRIIRVTFAINRYTLTAIAGLHGTISPSGGTSVIHGDSLVFTIAADSAYRIDSVLVDEVDQGPITEYRFLNVTAAHTIRAVFEAIPTSGIQVGVKAGWNLLSLPVDVDNDSVGVLFPGVVAPAFRYEGTYTPTDRLDRRCGYWLRFTGGSVLTLNGYTRTKDTVVVHAGWNMIGSVSATVPVASVTSIPSGIVASRYFGYEGSYVVATAIEPGWGFWVKVDADGALILDCSSAVVPKTSAARDPIEQMNSLTITDADGRTQTLWYGEGNEAGMEGAGALDQYELPPPGPDGSFDVRFGSGRMVELLERAGRGGVPLHVTGERYPLTVSWKTRDGLGATLKLKNHSVVLKGEGSRRVQRPEDLSGAILISGGVVFVPVRFELSQNYPNPFNPSTTISYGLPEESRVKITIFNQLGQIVTTVVEEVQSAGAQTIQWNATNAASGMYYCRLEASSTHNPANAFMKTIKMVLTR